MITNGLIMVATDFVIHRLSMVAIDDSPGDYHSGYGRHCNVYVLVYTQSN